MSEPTLTRAQERMLRILVAHSRSEKSRFPDSGGWVEIYDLFDAWGARMPLSLMLVTSSRVWRVLDRLGFVEDHEELSGVVRPTPKALAMYPDETEGQ